MDKSKLTESQRVFRTNVRNFLMVATREELERELTLSLDRGDDLRASFVRELIAELD